MIDDEKAEQLRQTAHLYEGMPRGDCASHHPDEPCGSETVLCRQWSMNDPARILNALRDKGDWMSAAELATATGHPKLNIRQTLSGRLRGQVESQSSNGRKFWRYSGDTVSQEIVDQPPTGQ